MIQKALNGFLSNMIEKSFMINNILRLTFQPKENQSHLQ